MRPWDGINSQCLCTRFPATQLFRTAGGKGFAHPLRYKTVLSCTVYKAAGSHGSAIYAHRSSVVE